MADTLCVPKGELSEEALLGKHPTTPWYLLRAASLTVRQAAAAFACCTALHAALCSGYCALWHSGLQYRTILQPLHILSFVPPGPLDAPHRAQNVATGAVAAGASGPSRLASAEPDASPGGRLPEAADSGAPAAAPEGSAFSSPAAAAVAFFFFLLRFFFAASEDAPPAASPPEVSPAPSCFAGEPPGLSAGRASAAAPAPAPFDESHLCEAEQQERMGRIHQESPHCPRLSGRLAPRTLLQQ